MTDTGWIAVGSIAAVVTALFTAAMAVAVVVTAFYAQRTLVAAKADSRARSRPVLIAYLERELLSHGTVLLVIKNFGPSSATNVHVTFDPPAPPIEALGALPDANMTKWLYQRFATPVPVWAPGWSTSNVIRAGQDPMPTWVVQVSYFGPNATEYWDRFVLDPAHILKTTSSTPSRTDDPLEVGRQAVSALQALVRTIRTR